MPAEGVVAVASTAANHVVDHVVPEIQRGRRQGKEFEIAQPPCNPGAIVAA
jgi:hypothetical protein